jgi:hypothetical protein
VRLRKGEARRFALFVSGTAVDALRVDAAFVRANGAVVPESPRMIAEGQSGGIAKLLFESDAAGLDAGPGALRITIHRNGMNDLKAILPLIVSQ